MTGPPPDADREAARQVQIVAQRAIRRLDVLEWVIFAIGALIATGGGAMVAWLLAGAGWPFRSTWIGASILLFAISGWIAIINIRKEERADALRGEGNRNGDDG